MAMEEKEAPPAAEEAAKGHPEAQEPPAAQEATPTPVPAPKAKAKGVSFKPTMRTGQRVILQGLKTEELNGHRGVVVRWKDDVGRYAVRVAGKEMGIKPENLKTEGGAAEAAKFQRKYGNTQGVMYNPVVYIRTPGAGPKMTQWIGQVKAGRRIIVRAETAPDLEDQPIPLWSGDRGFIGSQPVDVAFMIADIGSDAGAWPQAISRVLDRFPAAAGRLRQNKGRNNNGLWQILLNNAGVPFTTATVPPCGLPPAEELQLACSDDQCGFFDLGTTQDGVSDGEEPLLRLKLVYEEGTSKGVLGVSFQHALCDISGIGAMLRWLQSELDLSVPAPKEFPSFDRAAAQEALDAVPDITPEEEKAYLEHWPLSQRAMERWCFWARKFRSGLRGRPDGATSVFFVAPAATLAELKAEAEADGEASASTFEALVCYLGMKLLRHGRLGRRTLVTKDYRGALEAASPGKDLERLFANVVTHEVTFEMPDVSEASLTAMPLGEACRSMRAAVDSVSLGYVRWHTQQDHYRGLPNFFGGLCCNTWGRALADLGFVETYAVGMRAVDERAANMVFPLDTAYMQVFPQPGGSQTVLLTGPITDLTNLLKELPSDKFHLPHVSQMRTHAFRVPMPGQVVDLLNPTVETHHLFARIACIGDSVTAAGLEPGTERGGYPMYLQQAFDKAGIPTKVRNFGVPSTTAQKFADYPYWDEKKLEQARLWRPHFVIATFGHNDAKSSNWDIEAFEKDYADLCHEFLERMAPRPHVFLVIPPPLLKDGEYDMQQDIVNKELPASIRRIADKAARRLNDPLIEGFKRARKPVPDEAWTRVDVVDVFEMLGGAELRRKGSFAPDGVHLNEHGTRLLAFTVQAETRYAVGKLIRTLAGKQSSMDANPMDML